MDREPRGVDEVRSSAGPVATTATAVLAAGGIAATMLLAGPSALALAVVVVLAGAQVALLVGRRRGAVRGRQFLLAWSGQAGLTYGVAGDPTVASALVYLGVGLVFALVVLVGLRLTRPEVDPVPERRGDTQPLPVSDGE